MNNKSGSEQVGENWEYFLDRSYYDTWCVRNKCEREFHQSLHLNNRDEAVGLFNLLEAKDSQLSHLQKLCEEQKAKLNQYETESADENLCKKHPKTMLVYGCNACFEEQRVELEVERGISRSKNTELLEMSRKIEEQGRKVEAYDWAIGEWKKEEVLWKEREAGLLMRLDALKGLASMGVADVIKERDNTLSQIAHLNLVLEGYKVMAGLSTTDHLKVQGMIQKELEEQKAENERLNRLLELTRNKWNEDLAKEGRVVLLQSQLAEKEKEIAELKFVIMQRDAELTMRNDQLDKVRFQSDIYAKQVVLKEELINERSSQLATQTERIKELEHVVEVANKFTPYDKSLEWCKYADGSWHHVVIVDKILYTDGVETGRFEALNQEESK